MISISTEYSAFGGEGLWLFAILALFGFGGNGFFGRGNGENNAPATHADIDRSMQFSALREGISNNAAEIQRGIYEVNAATKDASYNTLSELRDVGTAVATSGANIINNLTALQANMQQCCCDTKGQILENRYLSSQNTNAIIQNETANSQKVLDKLAAMELANEQRYSQQLAQRVNQLEIANQMAGVVRYPMNSSWSIPGNPFCGAGCGNF